MVGVSGAVVVQERVANRGRVLELDKILCIKHMFGRLQPVDFRSRGAKQTKDPLDVHLVH